MCVTRNIIEDGAQDGGIDAFKEFAGADEVRKRRFVCACDNDHSVNVLCDDECVGDDGYGRRVDDDGVETLFEFFEQGGEFFGCEEFGRIFRDFAAR